MAAFFGEPWPSGVCDDGVQVPTPVGVPCSWCAEPIADGDRGSFIFAAHGPEPVHVECSLRSVVGGIGHLEDHERWCRTEGDPDGGRSARRSALEVWEWVHRHGIPR